MFSIKMDEKKQTENGNILWVERSHSPPNEKELQKNENIKRWKQLSDVVEKMNKKRDEQKNKLG